jgi:hypothetical protein
MIEKNLLIEITLRTLQRFFIYCANETVKNSKNEDKIHNARESPFRLCFYSSIRQFSRIKIEAYINAESAIPNEGNFGGLLQGCQGFSSCFPLHFR